MVIRPALVAFALAAALLAVGVGAYLAVRQNETAAVAAVSAGEAPAVDATERVVATEQVVEATEQVVEAPPTPRELAPSATTVQRAPAAPAAPVRAEAAVRPPPAARAAATDAPAPRDARAAAAGAGDPPNPRAPAVGARASAPDPAPDVPPGTGRPPRTQPRARTLPRVEGWERADGSRADGSRADGGRTADAARPVDAGLGVSPAPDVWRGQGNGGHDGAHGGPPGRDHPHFKTVGAAGCSVYATLQAGRKVLPLVEPGIHRRHGYAHQDHADKENPQGTGEYPRVGEYMAAHGSPVSRRR